MVEDCFEVESKVRSISSFIPIQKCERIVVCMRMLHQRLHATSLAPHTAGGTAGAWVRISHPPKETKSSQALNPSYNYCDELRPNQLKHSRGFCSAIEQICHDLFNP